MSATASSGSHAAASECCVQRRLESRLARRSPRRPSRFRPQRAAREPCRPDREQRPARPCDRDRAREARVLARGGRALRAACRRCGPGRLSSRCAAPAGSCFRTAARSTWFTRSARAVTSVASCDRRAANTSCTSRTTTQGSSTASPAAERDAFVEGSAGVTVVVERLLELKPPELPGVVVWPGFDEAILSPRRARDETRSALGVPDGALLLFYNGNVHETNLVDMRELYAAVGRLRDAGRPRRSREVRLELRAVVVPAGARRCPSRPRLGRPPGTSPICCTPPTCSSSRARPARSTTIASRRSCPSSSPRDDPVVLPRTNIGLELRDGEQALLLIRPRRRDRRSRRGARRRPGVPRADR